MDIMYRYTCSGQIPRHGLTLEQWECPRQWGEMSATVGGPGGCLRQWGNVCNSGGNVRNSGEIECGLGNLRVEIDP